MINEKGKRKLEFQGEAFYWYIEKDKTGYPIIHIISADKKRQFIEGFDREMILGPKDIKEIIEKNYDGLQNPK